MFDTLIIIPAYNEEKNIRNVIAGIQNLCLDMDILVINDGSNDKTETTIRKAGTDVISLPYNLGYGGALQTGFKYAVSKGYRYVIQFDGDGQHTPEYLKKIYDELKKGDVDIVIGSRFMESGSFRAGTLKKIALAFFRILIRQFTGIRITDPTSGLQGLSRRVFGYYSIKGNFPGDYPDADIIIHMLKCSYKIREIPVIIRQRAEGKSMHSGIKPVYYLVKVFLSILISLLRDKLNRRSSEYYE